jgi:plasmid stability protein
MARTTLDLDGSVLADLRRRSAAEGKSMGQVASELLAAALAAAEDRGGASFAWHSADLGAARVDLEDKDALHRALDG